MARKKKQIIPPEWSHLIEAESITDKRTSLTISPSDAERKKLAKRLGVVSLDSLKASLKLERDSGLIIHVSGSLQAKVTQKCVVTTDLVQNTIKEDFEAWYADPAQAVSITKARHERLSKKGNVEVPILEESEDPEPIIDGQIDLGELVTQYLSLYIDPYPHIEGVEFEGSEAEKRLSKESSFSNPFAALKAWKAQQE